MDNGTGKSSGIMGKASVRTMDCEVAIRDHSRGPARAVPGQPEPARTGLDQQGSIRAVRPVHPARSARPVRSVRPVARPVCSARPVRPSGPSLRTVPSGPSGPSAPSVHPVRRSAPSTFTEKNRGPSPDAQAHISTYPATFPEKLFKKIALKES